MPEGKTGTFPTSTGQVVSICRWSNCVLHPQNSSEVPEPGWGSGGGRGCFVETALRQAISPSDTASAAVGLLPSGSHISCGLLPCLDSQWKGQHPPVSLRPQLRPMHPLRSKHYILHKPSFDIQYTRSIAYIIQASDHFLHS